MLTALFVFGCSLAHAEARPNVDALELHALTSAQTIGQLRREMSIFEKLATLELACQLQLDHQQIPFSCYDAVALRTLNHLPAESAFYRGLDRKCERIAAATRELDIPSENHLPKACLATVKEKIRINRYKAGMDFEKFQ